MKENNSTLDIRVLTLDNFFDGRPAQGPKSSQKNCRNWANYNRAQVDELPEFLKILSKILDGMCLPNLWKGNGRPPKDLREMIKCCAIRVFFNFSYRRTVSILKLFDSAASLQSIPHFNTIRNYTVKFELEPILSALVERTSAPLKKVEESFAVDATGFATSVKVHWVDIRARKEALKKDYKKLNIVAGTKLKTVTAAIVTGATEHESPYFGTLMKETSKNFKIREVLGDSGYLSRKNCKIVDELGGRPYFKPKRGLRRLALGSLAWKRMLYEYKQDEERWLKKYHKRSNVEAAFSAIKRKFSTFVRSKVETGQANEILLKVVCYNVTVLILASLEFGIKSLA